MVRNKIVLEWIKIKQYVSGPPLEVNMPDGNLFFPIVVLDDWGTGQEVMSNENLTWGVYYQNVYSMTDVSQRSIPLHFARYIITYSATIIKDYFEMLSPNLYFQTWKHNYASEGYVLVAKIMTE